MQQTGIIAKPIGPADDNDCNCGQERTCRQVPFRGCVPCQFRDCELAENLNSEYVLLLYLEDEDVVEQ